MTKLLNLFFPRIFLSAVYGSLPTCYSMTASPRVTAISSLFCFFHLLFMGGGRVAAGGGGVGVAVHLLFSQLLTGSCGGTIENINRQSHQVIGKHRY